MYSDTANMILEKNEEEDDNNYSDSKSKMEENASNKLDNFDQD